MSEPPLPRIGHAERDRACERLRDAAGEGRLDLDELEQRLEQALAAKTQPELDALLADLGPTTSGPGHVPVVASSPPAVPAAPGHRHDDPLVLAAGTGSVKRTGVWEVPPWLRLQPSMGSIKLDFRRARVLHDVVDVEVRGAVGSVTLVLPPGWGANVDRMGSGIGSVRHKVPSVAESGRPLLVLHGSMGAGTLTIRPARWWDPKVQDGS